jgi:hypothetical protein
MFWQAVRENGTGDMDIQKIVCSATFIKIGLGTLIGWCKPGVLGWRAIDGGRRMRAVLPVVLVATILTGCATTSQLGKMSGGTVPAPQVNANTGAWLLLGNRVNGKAEVTCGQFLFVKTCGGDVGKSGSLTQELLSQGPLQTFQSFSIGDLLFGPPVSENQAVRAAYYNILDAGNTDSVLQVKAKTSVSGFSFLGLFGWGRATAMIEGIGAKVVTLKQGGSQP